MALFVSPFSNGQRCGAEIRKEFTLSIVQKPPLFVPTSSQIR